MKRITLDRVYYENGTLGRIQELGIWILERPWVNNERNVSCIPEGLYLVKPDMEGRYTGYPELQNVYGRTEIIIHPANRVNQLEGCLAPGLTASINEHELPTVSDSGAAFNRIKQLGPTFELLIRKKD